MRCLHKPLLCSSVTFHFQQERIVLNSLFMINCSCWTDFFFLILRFMAQMAYCHPAYWNQMIRKRLKLFKQSFCVGSIWIRITYGVKLYSGPSEKYNCCWPMQASDKSSLGREEELRRVGFKSTHKFISHEIFMEKRLLEKCQNLLLGHCLLYCLGRKPYNNTWESCCVF